MNYGKGIFILFHDMYNYIIYAISIIYIVIKKGDSKMSESCPEFFSSEADFVFRGGQKYFDLWQKNSRKERKIFLPPPP